MELPVEHGLLLDNLLDLAHAPFTHTSTFAKGWTVPRFVLLTFTVELEQNILQDGEKIISIRRKGLSVFQWFPHGEPVIYFKWCERQCTIECTTVWIAICKSLICDQSALYLIGARNQFTGVCGESFYVRVRKCDLNSLYFVCDPNPQLGEIFDACIWPPRVLGSLSHRYGISTTLHGVINHWDLKAWKTRGSKHQGVCNSPSPTSCLLAFLKTKD